ncbi:MAG: hypothetical protein NTW87_14890 [Planctomycetota bacterium]|nr:hypothetical protein [Planctomycetota bacterium]
MKRQAFSLDENLARCLAARRSLERRCKTREGLANFLFALEQEPLRAPTVEVKPIRARARPFQQDEEAERCRRVRDEMSRRFKMVDALCDHLERQEKEARTKRAGRSATAQAHRRARPAARNVKAAHGKPVHRA